jgi:NhaA family Na+:H+ antiporter
MARPAVSRLLRALVRPFQAFLRTESSGGLALMATTVMAMAWANSRWAAAYHQIFDTLITLRAGRFGAAWPAQHWVNEALMTVFFLVVGMEIKRELAVGELASVRRALLPALAALGGMIVPALLYLVFNLHGEGRSGWGTPMATDIAFALGCLSLLGKRVPHSLSVLLTALAIFDDLGAILVIALFYGGTMDPGWLAISLLLGLVLGSMNALGARSPGPYLAVGALLWVALLHAGIHPTLAGVVLGLAIPVTPSLTPSEALEELEHDVEELRQAVRADGEQGHAALASIERKVELAQAPLDRLQHQLHPWVALGIVPFFALANAGVHVAGTSLSGSAGRVALGVAVGLFIGKPLGVTLAVLLAVKTGLCPRPAGASWAQIGGIAALAGIGFTMSVFVAGLAFPTDQPLVDAAKVGVLGASCLSAVIGMLILRFARSAPDREASEQAGSGPLPGD